MKSKILIVLAVLIVLGFIAPRFKNSDKSRENQPATSVTEIPAPVPEKLGQPIKDASKRVTKKPFGIYVTPKSSPVSPERFIGYHTGVDFETFSDEQNTDVLFYAVCDGKILLKKWASGYGGVMVQDCSINNHQVTVIYGHVKLSSISKSAGGPISKGEKIGLLGGGYTTETDGERKHLHLGIHKGITINLRGYVSNKLDLAEWIDFNSIIKN